MVAYWKLKYAKWTLKDVAREKRLESTVAGINRLKDALMTEIPVRRTGKNLLMGTWNIRNFDDNRFKNGPRLPESFFYLAEVISAFDIIAIQEICEDLAPLHLLMDTIGGQYKFIVTDMTLGAGGNRERLGFIYDSRTVDFRGVAGELVLPLGSEIEDQETRRQFARTPFGCEFQSGWFKFSFSTVHIYFGEEGKNTPQHERRIAEIAKVATEIAKRAKQDATQAYFLVGDFNIEDYESKTFDALETNGFEAFKYDVGSNHKRTSFYDQISFYPRPEMVEPVNPQLSGAKRVFNPFDFVFRDEDFGFYEPEVKATLHRRKTQAEQDILSLTAKLQRTDLSEKARKTAESALQTARNAVADSDEALADQGRREVYYRDDWRTYQVSDHLPLFVELNVDFSQRYLQRLVAAPDV